MTAFKDALDLTTGTIDRRARRYRNLVASISMLGIASALWAMIAWSWLPLLGWLLPIPLCAGFLVLDSVSVDRWRARLLRMWVEDDLDLGAFVASVGAIRILPPRTVGTMLASLPTGRHPLAGIDQARGPKAAVARTLITRQRNDSDRTIVAAIAYSSILASVTGAIVLGNWHSLWGCLAAVFAIVVGRSIRLIRLRRWRRSIELPEEQTRKLADFLFV